jgi:hypothetical protein
MHGHLTNGRLYNPEEARLLANLVVFAPLRSEGHHRVTDQQRTIVAIPMLRGKNGFFLRFLILASQEVLARWGAKGTSSWLCRQGQTHAMS